MSITRILFIGVTALLSLQGTSQVQDDFLDGDFSTNPPWVGDTSKFQVNPAFELQLKDTSKSSPAYLATASKAIYNASWEFKFRLGFNPSTSNYALAYLGAQKQDLSALPDGYYVRLGGASGSTDDFSLYKKTGGTAVKIIDGVDGKAATAPSGWIKVTRDSAGTWELLVDTSANRTGYVSEGTVFDNDHLVSEYFGFYCRYTSTRSDTFFFDSVTVTGSYYQDTSKPVVQKIQLLSNQTIDVFFSEKVDATTAQTLTHYQVDQGIGNPSSAVLDAADSTLVHLQFSSAFASGVQHQITIDQVEDRNGNVMLSHQESFTWITYDTLKPGDLIINEIFADPSPPVALPEKEFVEILNLSNKNLNLNGVTFSDPSKTATIGNYAIAPNEYIILCSTSDSLSFAPYGKVVAVTNFPSLNNTGDVLTLADSSGIKLDVVSYSDSWYGSSEKEDGGFTLELINPIHPCGGSSNWIGSDDVDGGTPGRKNSVFDTIPPTTRPVISSVQVTLPYELQVNFSELMDSTSLINASYSITPNNNHVINVIVSENPSDKARIVLFTSMDVGTVYQLSMSGATDCYGNLITTDSVSFGRGKAPSPYEVVINEIYPDPDGSKSALPEFEFVELHNTSDQLISLRSCAFSDASTSASLDGILIQPGGYLILCESQAVSEYRPYGEAIGLNDWPSLNNSGDDLFLTRDSTILHEVNYSSDWYADDAKKDGGWTLEMVDDANPCGEENNWRASIDAEGGTPGSVNSIKTSNPDESGPEIVRGGALDAKRIFILFSEAVSTTDTSSISIQSSPSFLIDSLIFTNRKTLEITLHQALRPQQIYTLIIDGMSDCVGNTSDNLTVDIGLPEEAESGDLVINEILFDPYSGASSDYVELYNRSEKVLDLQNWQLCEFDYIKDTLDGCKIIAESSYPLFPGDFVLINKDNAEIKRLYPTHDEKAFVQLSSLPTLSNDEGSVVVLNDTAVWIDRLDYTDDMHNALIRDPDGIALERVDYDLPTQDANNWNSAAKAVGYGTPGLKNSQYLPATDFSNQITVEPETFSPDNDGFDDVVHLNFNLNKDGFVAQVQIYDTEGRLVRDLANNELLGGQSTMTWNGDTDDGQKANTGIYIFFIELIDPEGNTERFKKTCVLALKF